MLDEPKKGEERGGEDEEDDADGEAGLLEALGDELQREAGGRGVEAVTEEAEEPVGDGLWRCGHHAPASEKGVGGVVEASYLIKRHSHYKIQFRSWVAFSKPQ